ncbi:MAG: hypothetical protein HY270_03290 [Deltaproteobacteria bacterium]|nr:hypothetical protein [Deltaproteobacteria bacterium]
MSSERTSSELPNVAAILAELLGRVPRDQQPLLIAVAERLAAKRYRSWAEEEAMQMHRETLVGCADREEEIANRIATLYCNATDIERTILEGNPDIGDINRRIFAGRPLLEQFQIQAQGERLGAATWRALAAKAGSTSQRDILLGCADLEEASAEKLEEILNLARPTPTT